MAVYQTMVFLNDRPILSYSVTAPYILYRRKLSYARCLFSFPIISSLIAAHRHALPDEIRQRPGHRTTGSGRTLAELASATEKGAGVRVN